MEALLIRNPEYLEELEASLPQLTYHQAATILDSLWEEARTLGAWPPDDPLAGIETDIRVAAILNSCLKS